MAPEGEIVNHTPPPWGVEVRDSIEVWSERRDGNVMYRECIAVTVGDHAEAHADALLIAAAPDLLAACKAVERALENENYVYERDRQTLRDAIAKAEGRAS